MAHWVTIATLVLQGTSFVSSSFTDYRTRQASKASRVVSEQTSQTEEIRHRLFEQTAQTEEARRKLFEAYGRAIERDEVLQRTVDIPSNAFNAGPQFTTVFTSNFIIGAILLAKVANELRQLNLHVKDIRDELGAQTTAMIQGWQNTGFGDHIYNFLRSEIDDYGGGEGHAFYIYNPTTSADVVFKQKVREQPLPPCFGGISSDIEAIFRLMWANRQTLRATMPRNTADAVVFHLLIPAKRTMAILDRMAIHESIGKLIIKGHMDEGSCYAWLNFVELPPEVTLHDIRNLDTDTSDRKRFEERDEAIMRAGIGFWVIAAVGGTLFPPIGLAGAVGFSAACTTVMATPALEAWQKSSRGPLRVLGPPLD